jgi:hypothetical protein
MNSGEALQVCILIARFGGVARRKILGIVGVLIDCGHIRIPDGAESRRT